MIPVNKEIYEEMKALGLLNPKIKKGENGKILRYRDNETKEWHKIVDKVCTIGSKHKKSKRKRPSVESPIIDIYNNLIKQYKIITRKVFNKMVSLGFVSFEDEKIKYFRTKDKLFIKNDIYNQYIKFCKVKPSDSL